MKRGCTQCGECLDVCPVFREFMREEYAPKGKRLLLEPLDKDYGSGEGTVDPDLSWEHVKGLARLCAGCGRCKLVCARKLSTADLLADARAGHPHWSQYLWEIWIRRLGPLWPTIGFAASLLPDSLTPKTLQSSIAPARALVNRGDVPPWAKIAPDPDKSAGEPLPVLLFAGCTANRVRRQWTRKAETLLRRFGHSVLDASGLVCCGATMHHAGLYNTMRDMRERNVAAWRELGRPRIAAFCASCFHGLQEYAGCFANDEEAATWKQSLTPLSAMLAGAKAQALPAGPGRFGYHQPCHWADADKDMPFLQSLFDGLVKGSGLCCGMGGVLKMSNPGLSMRMADTCMAGFPQDTKNILTGCSGCMLQLAAAAPGGVTVLHWLDVLC